MEDPSIFFGAGGGVRFWQKNRNVSILKGIFLFFIVALSLSLSTLSLSLSLSLSGRQADRQADRQTETDRDRQRLTETGRDRQRQTETDRDRKRSPFHPFSFKNNENKRFPYKIETFRFFCQNRTPLPAPKKIEGSSISSARRFASTSFLYSWWTLGVISSYLKTSVLTFSS